MTYLEGNPSGMLGEEESAIPLPENLHTRSLSDSSPEILVAKLLESVQDERLDRIRSITFSSLNTEDPFNESRGVFRGLQVIFLAGRGHFLKQAFSFTPEWLESVDFTDTKVKGRSLKSLAGDRDAYSRLYKEYLNIYSLKPSFREDLIGLCNVEDVKPDTLRPLVRLLLLIVISSNF